MNFDLEPLKKLNDILEPSVYQDYENKILSLFQKMRAYQNYNTPQIKNYHPIFFEAQKEINNIEDNLNAFFRNQDIPLMQKVQSIQALGVVFKDFHKQITEKHLFVLENYKIPIPKKMHFVWIGGGLPEENQVNLKIWSQVTDPDWKITLWVDSKRILLNTLRKEIIKFSDQQFTHNNKMLLNDFSLKKLNDKQYKISEELAIKKTKIILANKVFFHEFYTLKKTEGWKEEDIYIKFLTHHLQWEKDNIQKILTQQKKVLLNLQIENPRIKFREISELMLHERTKQLEPIYNLETSLRLNLAAASDIVRYQILDLEGGAYYDLDRVPPLGAKAQNIMHAMNIDHTAFIKSCLYRYYPASLKKKLMSELNPIVYKISSKIDKPFTSIKPISIIPGHLVPAELCGNATLFSHPHSLSRNPEKDFSSLFEIILKNYTFILKNPTHYATDEQIETTIQEAFSRFHAGKQMEDIRTLSLEKPNEFYLLDSIIPYALSTLYFTGPRVLSIYWYNFYQSILKPSKYNKIFLKEMLNNAGAFWSVYPSLLQKFHSLYPHNTYNFYTQYYFESSWLPEHLSIIDLTEESIAKYLPKINKRSFYKYNIQLVFLDESNPKNLQKSAKHLFYKHGYKTVQFFVKNKKIYHDPEATQEIQEYLKTNAFTRLHLMGYPKIENDEFSFAKHSVQEISDLLLKYTDPENKFVGNIRILPLRLNTEPFDEIELVRFCCFIANQLKQNKKIGVAVTNLHLIEINKDGRKIRSYEDSGSTFKNRIPFDSIHSIPSEWNTVILPKEKSFLAHIKSKVYNQNIQEFEKSYGALQTKLLSKKQILRRTHSETNIYSSDSIEKIKLSSVSNQTLHSKLSQSVKHIVEQSLESEQHPRKRRFGIGSQRKNDD